MDVIVALMCAAFSREVGVWAKDLFVVILRENFSYCIFRGVIL
jgi:hypothetical protein